MPGQTMKNALNEQRLAPTKMNERDDACICLILNIQIKLHTHTHTQFVSYVAKWLVVLDVPPWWSYRFFPNTMPIYTYILIIDNPASNDSQTDSLIIIAYRALCKIARHQQILNAVCHTHLLYRIYIPLLISSVLGPRTPRTPSLTLCMGTY